MQQRGGTGQDYNAFINGFDISRIVPTAEENRPINYSVNICIIYE